MLIKITWDFSDTEFENLGHRIASENLGLPIELDIEDIDCDYIDLDDIQSSKEDIKDYLYENYSFEVKRIKIIE